MKIINLKNDLIDFWNTAKNKDFDERVLLWDQILEKKYEYLFTKQVWRKDSRENWEQFKSERLSTTFKYYDQNFDKTIRIFDSFKETFEVQSKKYNELFPDSDFSKTQIIVMPSAMTFNGRGADYKGETALYLGIDFISSRNDDLDILYSHELFHIYHIDRMKVNEEIFLKEGKLTLPLWLEGFATWISGEFNKNKSLDALLMDDNYKDIKETEVKRIAKKFLTNAEELASNNNMKIYQSWFNLQQAPILENLPSRLGYFLGYFVIKEVVKNHDINEMVYWEHEKVHREVLIALKILQN